MYDFAYYAPLTLEDASRLLEADETKLLAGGMSLLPTMKFRLARHRVLVDLRKISELNGIRREGDCLVIGATTRHAVVAGSALVRSAIPALAALAGDIGDPLVRNRGTIGGSIANADPAADYPSSVLALAATVVTDRREIDGNAFFLGLFQTALETNEIIREIRFPIPDAAGYAKYPNPASRFATVGVFVAKTSKNVRVVVTGAADYVFRLGQAEKLLSSEFTPKALDTLEVDPALLNSDIHTSAEYKAHVITVMAKRAVTSAGGR
jgi:carbon-monoxide dehydrogenase medium subunit